MKKEFQQHNTEEEMKRIKQIVSDYYIMCRKKFNVDDAIDICARQFFLEHSKIEELLDMKKGKEA